jgi:hypothetical protein
MNSKAPNNHWDWWDIVADVAGIGVGVGMELGIFGTGRCGMDYKTLVMALVALIVAVALCMSAYKKNLRTTAKRKEITWVAVILSVVLTTSLGFGLGFPGIPWALVAYCIVVFFLQWFINQKVVDKLWAVLGLVAKAEAKKRDIDIGEVLK